MKLIEENNETGAQPVLLMILNSLSMEIKLLPVVRVMVRKSLSGLMRRIYSGRSARDN